MTTRDLSNLTTLAHAAGAAGRSWAQFQGDDAVQDYVCANDDYENHIEAWRAAWQTGAAQHLAVQGWVSRWTTAPTDYDCFGTTTAELCGDWHGKPLRRILCHPHHVSYQEGRNGSGMHPTWSVDPRIEEREAAARHDRLTRLRAEDEERRAMGLVWLAGASEAEIEGAEERDEVELRGLKYTDLRDELKRRAEVSAAADRAATWARCRAAFEDGAILVDNGTPGQRGVYGWIPGHPSRIYYGVRVVEHWAHPGDAEQATVITGGRGATPAGSLAYVADWISSGRCRVVTAGDVPPEPVTRRIGQDRWQEIVKIQAGDRTVWVGRALGAYEPLILDAAGRLIRAKAACASALAGFLAANRARLTPVNSEPGQGPLSDPREP